MLYIFRMSSVKEIEAAVSKLSGEDLSLFRTWFADFDAEAWDRQFEQDVKAGRLDGLAEEALHDLVEGRCTDL
jgi:hypothetical protein